MTRNALVLAAASGFAAIAHAEQASQHGVVGRVVQAAEALLDSLDGEQRGQLLYDFDDQQQRRNWSNLPTSSVDRGGLRMGDLSYPQREAVRGLIRATLSPAGYRQVIDNVDGDEALARGGGDRGRRMFGRDEFYVSLLGQPSTTTPWMWQFGGHHLAINATIVGDQITLGPSLTGGQPMDYTLDDRVVRQHASERHAAFELFGSLTPQQRASCVVSDRYARMIFGPGREDAAPKEEGLCAAELSESQRATLLRLIEERVGMLNAAHAAPRMQQIENDLDSTWFAWLGSTAEEGAWSYRIQGPTLLMEYCPQQLGGDPPNHIHAMYRDPTNDYGQRWLGGSNSGE